MLGQRAIWFHANSLFNLSRAVNGLVGVAIPGAPLFVFKR